MLDTHALDRNYVGKALERRASVLRHLLRPREAMVKMRHWVKDFGAPEATLKAVDQQLEVCAKLDAPAPVYRAEHWISGEPAPMELMSGRVVALYFFATWCPNCAKEIPQLADLPKR